MPVGFNSLSTKNGPYPYAVGSVLYDAYAAQMYAPFVFGCGPGQGKGGAHDCATNFMWAGIGGYETYLFSYFTPNLLQSGFATNFYGYSMELYAEFVSSNLVGLPKVWLPPPQDTFASGDVFFIQGWAGDANCNLTTNVPTQGCFYFEDDTNHWVTYAQLPYPADQNNNPQGTWWPVTVEYANEKSGGGINENYWLNAVYGEGLDSAGNWHLDPSSGSDPYVVVTETDSTGNPCSSFMWDNGTDPMLFVSETNPLCGPY